MTEELQQKSVKSQFQQQRQRSFFQDQFPGDILYKQGNQDEVLNKDKYKLDACRSKTGQSRLKQQQEYHFLKLQSKGNKQTFDSINLLRDILKQLQDLISKIFYCTANFQKTSTQRPQLAFYLQTKKSSEVQKLKSKFLSQKQIRQSFCVENEIPPVSHKVRQISIKQLHSIIERHQQFVINSQSIKQILGQIKLVIFFIEKQSLVSIKAFAGVLQQALTEFLASVEMCQQQITDLLIKLSNLYMCRSFGKNQLFQLIFPAIDQKMKSLREKLQLQSIQTKISKLEKAKIQINHYKVQFLDRFKIQNKLDIKNHRVDQILFSFYEEVSQSSAQQGKLKKFQVKIQNKILSLNQFIYQYGKECQNGFSSFIDIISQIQFKYQHNYQKIGTYDQILKLNFLEKMEMYSLPDNANPCCSTFYYEGLNISDNSVQKIPFMCLKSINQLNQTKKQLVEGVCALLNSGGGTIFFDLKAQFRKLLGYGTVITQQMKEDIKQQILKIILENLSPVKNINELIIIEFVPVAANPFLQKPKINSDVRKQEENQQMEEESSNQLLYLKGKYITRIKVCPQATARPYFVKEDQTLRCFKFVNNAVVELQNSSVIKLIKKRVKNQFDNQPTSSCFDHICTQPQVGAKIHSLDQLQKQLNQFQLEKQFNQMYLLVIKKKNIPQLQHLLSQEGYQFRIVQAFADTGFRSIRHTVVLYINLKFQQTIKKIALNNRYTFDNKMLLTIKIGTSLKLQNRDENNPISPQLFKHIRDSVWKRYPQEQIELQEVVLFYNPNKGGCSIFILLIIGVLIKSIFKIAKRILNTASQLKTDTLEVKILIKESLILLNCYKRQINYKNYKSLKRCQFLQKGTKPNNFVANMLLCLRLHAICLKLSVLILLLQILSSEIHPILVQDLLPKVKNPKNLIKRVLDEFTQLGEHAKCYSAQDQTLYLLANNPQLVLNHPISTIK